MKSQIQPTRFGYRWRVTDDIPPWGEVVEPRVRAEGWRLTSAGARKAAERAQVRIESSDSWTDLVPEHQARHCPDYFPEGEGEK